MYKMVGCILIITACSGIGYLKGLDIQKHLTEIKTLRQLFLMLRSEIKYKKAPLGEAFWNIGRRMEGKYEEWLIELSEKLEEKSGSTFMEIWADTIENNLKDTNLNQTDLKNLKELGLHMGYLDGEMQIGTIGLFLEQLEIEIQRMRENIVTQRRICNCLGVMGGIFLSIILI